MITVWGEGRGFRVVWLLEEMGLAYTLRDVDLLAGIENDPEFLAVNPAGFIPALTEGDVTMVESIAIMEYLLARHGHRGLVPDVGDAAFALYQQFLHLGEAGLAATLFIGAVSPWLAPEGERDNWGARFSRQLFESRRALVERQLARTPWLAGASFSAADISVVWALQFARRQNQATFTPAEADYVARATARDGYRCAMAACHATRGWVERIGGE